MDMIERHGSVVLLVGGCILLVGGLWASDSGAEVALCALGASLLVLAVVVTRTEGQLKLGPGGLEAKLRRVATEEALEVSESLADEGLDDLVATASGTRSLEEVAQPERIQQAVASLVETLERLESTQVRAESPAPAGALLEAAHGLMASGDWPGAAQYFDRYVVLEPDNWDAQFSRAVAHANSRGGTETNLASLRAYNDAIALRPSDTDTNLVARLFSYRGAILKRLERLPEAEADLHIAEGLATEDYEMNDIRYNLACVYAMTGRKAEALALIHSLEGTPFIGAIHGNRLLYFTALQDDPEFVEMVGS